MPKLTFTTLRLLTSWYRAISTLLMEGKTVGSSGAMALTTPRSYPAGLPCSSRRLAKHLPSQAAADVLTKEGNVKDMVRSVVEDGGHYIMLCAHPYTRKQVVARENEYP